MIRDFGIFVATVSTLALISAALLGTWGRFLLRARIRAERYEDKLTEWESPS